MASSRGKPAYAAIMLALTLVIIGRGRGRQPLRLLALPQVVPLPRRLRQRRPPALRAARDAQHLPAVDPEHRGRVPRRGLLDDAALRLDLRHDGPPRGLQAARGRRRRRSGGARNGARGGCRRRAGRARRSVIGPIGMSKEKDYAAAASGLASWHSSQDAASAALRAKHRLQRHPTAGRVNRNGRATFSPKFSGAGRGA